MSKMINMEISDFLDLLKSNAPAPGGGSVSALSGAQGMALMMMVIQLTVGREKYKDYDEICFESLEKGNVLFNELKASMDEDTDAYNVVMESFGLPKNTDEEKAARKKAIREATLGATEVPFKVMKLSLDGLELVKSLLGKTNSNASSDLGVAALCLLTAAKGAWLNVKVNVPGLKDEEKEKYFVTKGTEILEKCEILAEEIYQK